MIKYSCVHEDMKVKMFFCSSHRSDPSKSEVSIGEEIEEGSIEGPDISDKVSLTVSPEHTGP